MSYFLDVDYFLQIRRKNYHGFPCSIVLKLSGLYRVSNKNYEWWAQCFSSLVVQGSKKPGSKRVKLKILEIFNNLFQISISDINS